MEAAEALLESFASAASLADLETRLAADRDRYPLLVHLAVKLARSKRLLAAVTEPVHLTIVFAVYKEHHRIRTQAEHPHGENFLLRKIAQLNWLFGDQAQFSWDMLIVDDGDPEKSGEIAQEILASHYDGDNVRVLFLEEAIRQGLPVTHPMTDTAESQKGGPGRPPVSYHHLHRCGSLHPPGADRAADRQPPPPGHSRGHRLPARGDLHRGQRRHPQPAW